MADFIHIDIVDKTFKPDAHEVKTYKAEVVRAFWQKKPIEVHIMSKHPSRWIPDLMPYVNSIYIHINIDEDMSAVLAAIKAHKCNAGIVVSINDAPAQWLPYLDEVQNVLLLAIPNPGFSGQHFDMKALDYIELINQHKNRASIYLCVDGGVNNKTIGYLNVDGVVSGSFVLDGENPKKNIMYLQTSGEYEKY